MKYTILTCLFGDYDTLKDPEEIDEDAKYICITDRKDLQSNVWNIIYDSFYDTDQLNGIQKSFLVKYHFIQQYISYEDEYIIRLDASIAIHKSLRPIVDFMKENNYDCLVQYHNSRTDMIDEYNAWFKERNQDVKYKDQFLRKMSKVGYDFSQPGLLGTTIQIYKNCPQCIKFIHDMDNLIKETEYKDNNDQCYYTYALSKNIENMNVLFTNIQIIASSYMDYCYHYSDKVMFDNHEIGNGYNIYLNNYQPLFGNYVKIHYFV